MARKDRTKSKKGRSTYTSPAAEVGTPTLPQVPWWLAPLGLLLALVALAAAIPSTFAVPFAQDDYRFLANVVNPEQPLSEILAPLPMNRPVARYGYFAVVLGLAGENPFAFHVAQFFLHVLNVLLFWWLLRLLFPTRPLLAWLAALGSICHGSYMTIFVWISCVQELLMGTFALGALVSLKLYATRPALAAAVALPLWLLALGSKEAAVGVPVVGAAMLLFTAQGATREEMRAELSRLRSLLLGCGVAVLLGVVWLLAFRQPEAAGPYSPELGLHILRNLQNYLWFVVRPWASPDALEGGYGELVWRPWLESGALLGLMVWLGNRRAVLLGSCWFLVFLGPVLLLPTHFYRYYLYLPYFGAALMLAAQWDGLCQRWADPVWRVSMAIVGTLLMGLFVGLGAQAIQAVVGPAVRAEMRANVGLIRRAYQGKHALETLRTDLGALTGEVAMSFRPNLSRSSSPQYYDRQFAGALNYGDALRFAFPEARLTSEFFAYAAAEFPSAFPGKRHFVVEYSPTGHILRIREQE